MVGCALLGMRGRSKDTQSTGVWHVACGMYPTVEWGLLHQPSHYDMLFGLKSEGPTRSLWAAPNNWFGLSL